MAPGAARTAQVHELPVIKLALLYRVSPLLHAAVFLSIPRVLLYFGYESEKVVNFFCNAALLAPCFSSRSTRR